MTKDGIVMQDAIASRKSGSFREPGRRARSHCSSCSLSRRCFLKTVAAGAASMGALPAAVAAGDGDLGDYIDLASFRPRPKARIHSAVIRLKPPYWLGWPGTAYDLEGRLREYGEAWRKAAARLGVTLTEEPAPLESNEMVDAFVAKVRAEEPDAAFISLQHLNVWNHVERVAGTGIPTIVFSPIGTAFTNHVIDISRRPRVDVVSSLEVAAVEQAFRMIRAKRQLEESRLLIVDGNSRSESVLERLGIKIRYIPRDSLHQLFEKMPENDEVHDVARRMRRAADRIVEPSRKDTLNAARSFTTAKRLMRDERANAISTDCLGMVTSRVVPTPPCMAASLFQDTGVTYGCEADIYAAVSQMFVSYLFDKPGFINDPVPETVKNVLIAAHCTCGTRLDGFEERPHPLILRSHSESDIGVAAQVVWPEGEPVTLVDFMDPNRLILDTGTVVGNVSTPPAGGCRTSFEIAMDRVEDCRDVRGFHQVVFVGDHRRDIEAFCQMFGIEVLHSPERHEKARTS